MTRGLGARLRLVNTHLLKREAFPVRDSNSFALFAQRTAPFFTCQPTKAHIRATGKGSVTHALLAGSSRFCSPTAAAKSLKSRFRLFSTIARMDTPELRSKRKQPPSPVLERPPKHNRPGTVPIIEGDSTPEVDHLNGVETDLDDTLPAHVRQVAAADTAEWQATIEAVVKNVVSIRFCQTCSFDTDTAVSSEATGFVVDAEAGYILTNRHVVCAGPFWGYCIFDNHEEVLLLLYAYESKYILTAAV